MTRFEYVPPLVPVVAGLALVDIVTSVHRLFAAPAAAPSVRARPSPVSPPPDVPRPR